PLRPAATTLSPYTTLFRSALADRLLRWHKLQSIKNADKKIALVYYNHPPGRHNVGADKLDVPESLFEILQSLQRAGYTTGELPKDRKSTRLNSSHVKISYA